MGDTLPRYIAAAVQAAPDIDLGALFAFHEGHGAEGTIALTQVEDPSHFGVVPTDAHGRVEAFVEKPSRGEAPTDLINAGFYVLEASVLDRIPEGRPANIERETFPAMVADGSLYARADPAYWIDVGTPERYLQASLDLVDGRRETRGEAIAADAIVDGDVRNSVIGAGARVAAGARVTDSVVLPGASIASGAVVTRSVVGHGAAVGDGAVLTSGGVVCKPGIVTSVVETAEQLLDMRHLDASKLASMWEQVREACERFA